MLSPQNNIIYLLQLLLLIDLNYQWETENIKVIRNLKMLVVGHLRHTFLTRHNLIYNCLITKSLNPPDRVNIKVHVEYFFAWDSLFRKVQQTVQIQ